MASSHQPSKSLPRDFLWQTLRTTQQGGFWEMHPGSLCNAEETGEEGDGDSQVTTGEPAPESYFSYAPYPNFYHFMFLLYVHILLCCLLL